MSQLTSGPCLMCAEETTSRCEACRQAGIDLFFCSKEHQKLLWPVHRLVCGPGKANPFTWPDLSEEEADETKLHVDTMLFAEGLDTIRSILACVGAPDAEQTAFLDTLVEGRKCTLSGAEKQDYLVMLRHAVFESRSTRKPCDGLTAVHVLRVASHVTLRCLSALHLRDSVPDWYSRFLHRLLYHLFLSGVYEGGRKLASARATSVLSQRRGYDTLVELVNVEVRRTDPVAAGRLLIILKSFAKLTGVAPQLLIGRTSDGT